MKKLISFLTITLVSILQVNEQLWASIKWRTKINKQVKIIKNEKNNLIFFAIEY
jgi:hypothetical protein